MPGIGARGPFSGGRRSDLSPLSFAAQGGRIFTQSVAASGANVRFKGRYLQRFTGRPPVEIVPTWLCWRASSTNATPETAITNAVPMTAVAAVIYDTDAVTPLGSVAVVTKNASAGFTVPTGIDTFFADTLTPASFGLTAFPPRGYIEWRVLYDLAAGQNAPGGIGSNRPGQQQSYQGTVAQLPNDVVATGPMSSTSTIYIPMFFPIALGRFRGAVRSVLLIGDSLTARDNDFVPIVGAASNLPAGGGGLFSRACIAADVPFFNAGIAGRTATGANLSTRTIALAQYARVATTCLGANDIAFTFPGGSAGQPITVAYMTGQSKALWAALRATGVGRIIAATIPPRLADNNYKCTDLAQMTPYVSQATVAGGAPSNGYGFGAGETAEQWNAALLALANAADGPDAVFDFNSYCRDTTTASKWKLHPFNTTLAASVAIGATSLSFNASPPQFCTPVLEPGVAGVDGATQMCALSIAGAGPYTITVGGSDVYSNTAAVYAVPTKAHSSGAAVKGTNSFDGTHPTTELHRTLAAPLAATL